MRGFLFGSVVAVGLLGGTLLLNGCGNRSSKSGKGSATSAHASTAAKSAAKPAAEPGTYAAIAPILHQSCTTCHRPNGAAPFSLLDAKQARKRSELIAEVLRDGSMPPWLPSDKGLPLANARKLSDTNRTALLAWAESGAPIGDLKAVPTPPVYNDDGWQLGEPDAVTGLGPPLTVPADGPDVFRNLVIPWPETRRRYVKSVEIRPGNQRAVHHAILKVDRSGMARYFDEQDPETGFAGMEMGGARSPSGHFIGWTPGKVADTIDEELAWAIDPGSDLVLQLHMPPTGKEETVEPSIGFTFSDEAPPRQPWGILLFSRDIVIPAGSTNVVATDRFLLPTPVSLRGIYPHTHYLAREFTATAMLPDGSEQTLLHIPDWDFNWQDDYRLAEPFELPALTELHFAVRFDNSAANPQNPNDPPLDVAFGPASTNEMAAVHFQVVPKDAKDLHLLQEKQLEERLKKDVDDWAAWNALGEHVVALDPKRAEICFRRAIKGNPEYANPLYHLGLLFQKQGRNGEASQYYQQAIALRSNFAAALGNLGTLEIQIGEAESGIAHLRQALAANPRLAMVHSNLGGVLCARGNVEEGIVHLQRCIDLAPQTLQAHLNFVRALRLAKRDKDARTAAEHGLTVARSQGAESAIAFFEKELSR